MTTQANPKPKKSDKPEWEENLKPKFQVGAKVTMAEGLRDGSTMTYDGEVIRTLPRRRYLLRWFDSTSGRFPTDPQPVAESKLRRFREAD